MFLILFSDAPGFTLDHCTDDDLQAQGPHARSYVFAIFREDEEAHGGYEWIIEQQSRHRWSMSKQIDALRVKWQQSFEGFEIPDARITFQTKHAAEEHVQVWRDSLLRFQRSDERQRRDHARRCSGKSHNCQGTWIFTSLQQPWCGNLGKHLSISASITLTSINICLHPHRQLHITTSVPASFNILPSLPAHQFKVGTFDYTKSTTSMYNHRSVHCSRTMINNIQQPQHASQGTSSIS